VRDVALWSLPEGLLAARVAYVLVHPEIYLIAPTRVVHLWDGGFAFGAGLVAGVLAAWRYARGRGLPFGRLADVAVPGLLLGQALAILGSTLGAGDAQGPRIFQVLWALALLALYAVLVQSRWRPGWLFLGYLELQALGQVAVGLLGVSTELGGVLGAGGWIAIAVTAALAALYHLRSTARRAMRDE
jgi:phosphatidylglycerol:prolipoprotein diacylglycerol transferase